MAVMGFDIGTDLLPLTDAARVLKISRATLFRYLRQGRLASIEHGGRRFIERAEIQDYFARRSAEGRKQRHERARRTQRGGRQVNGRKARSAQVGEGQPTEDLWCGGIGTVAQIPDRHSHPSGRTA
jgi:excisionase family DNA binding protein